MEISWLLLTIIIFSISYLYLFRQGDHPKKKTFFIIGASFYFFLQYLIFSPFYQKINWDYALIFESVSYFILAPIFTLSIPSSKVRFFFWNHKLKPIIKIVTNPFVIMGMFYGIFAFTHWMLLLSRMTETLWVFIVSHSVLLGLAMLLWFPIVNGVTELKTLSPFAKLFMLFGNGIMYFIGFSPALIISGASLGIVMALIIQELIIIISLGVLIKKWSPTANKVDRVDLSLQFK